MVVLVRFLKRFKFNGKTYPKRVILSNLVTKQGIFNKTAPSLANGNIYSGNGKKNPRDHRPRGFQNV
jgi:hypothetical protein